VLSTAAASLDNVFSTVACSSNAAAVLRIPKYSAPVQPGCP
jgi:hypothetical protein